MDVLYRLGVGAISGWLAGQVTKGKGFGLIGNMTIGLVGTFIGGWIFHTLGLRAPGMLGNIIVAFIGGVALVAALNLLQP